MIWKVAGRYDAAAIIAGSLDRIFVEQYVHFDTLLWEGMPKSECLKVIPIQPLHMQFQIRARLNTKLLFDASKLCEPIDVITTGGG